MPNDAGTRYQEAQKTQQPTQQEKCHPIPAATSRARLALEFPKSCSRRLHSRPHKPAFPVRASGREHQQHKRGTTPPSVGGSVRGHLRRRKRGLFCRWVKRPPNELRPHSRLRGGGGRRGSRARGGQRSLALCGRKRGPIHVSCAEWRGRGCIACFLLRCRTGPAPVVALATRRALAGNGGGHGFELALRREREIKRIRVEARKRKSTGHALPRPTRTEVEAQ